MQLRSRCASYGTLVHSIENGMFTSINQQRKILLCKLDSSALKPTFPFILFSCYSLNIAAIPVAARSIDYPHRYPTTFSPRATKWLKTTK